MIRDWRGANPDYHIKFKLEDWLEEDRIRRRDAYSLMLGAEKQDKSTYFKSKKKKD